MILSRALRRSFTPFTRKRWSAASTSIARRHFFGDSSPEEHAVVDIYKYPPSRANTVFNVCPQGKMMVVERLGKFHSVQEPGFFFAIPFVDEIAYEHDMRELSIRIDPQKATTKDNVSATLGGNVYLRVVDAYDGSYGARRPIYAVVQHAQSALRAGVGTMDLDELFHNRQALNTYLQDAIAKAVDKWGLEVLRYEVTEITPDRAVQQAMDLQAVAERKRREEILGAEAHKRGTVLRSEGARQDAVNVSEGEKIKRINEAEGKARQIVLESEAQKEAVINQAVAEAESIRVRMIAEAEGEALQIVKCAEAQAQAISVVAKQIAEKDGMAALQYNMAQQYLESYKEVVGHSNTVILGDNISDPSSMIARGLTLASNMGISATNAPDKAGHNK